jgi:hypothetical protein
LTDITDSDGLTRFTKDGDRQLPDETTAYDLAMNLINVRTPEAMSSCPHAGCGMPSAGVHVGWDGVRGDDTAKSTSMFGMSSTIN